MSTVSREQVVAEARTWLGTPFHHQARRKGIGVDCVGVVIGVARALGLSNFNTTAYSRQPNPARMRALLLEHLDPVGFRDLAPGDILWIRVETSPQHLGIVETVSPLVMIHAFHKKGVDACVRQPFDGFWRDRLVGCFRYRGLA